MLPREGEGKERERERSEKADRCQHKSHYKQICVEVSQDKCWVWAANRTHRLKIGSMAGDTTKLHLNKQNGEWYLEVCGNRFFNCKF